MPTAKLAAPAWLCTGSSRPGPIGTWLFRWNHPPAGTVHAVARAAGTPTRPPPWLARIHLWVLLTIKSTPASSSGMRPKACVTSTASSAGECARTASTTGGSESIKPLKKLTSEVVTRRVWGPKSGIRSATCSAPAREGQIFTAAGQLGCSHGVLPAG